MATIKTRERSLDQKLTPSPPQNPLLNFLALKFPESKTSLVVNAELHVSAGTTTNIQILLNTPQKTLLTQATQKIPAKFSYLKK